MAFARNPEQIQTAVAVDISEPVPRLPLRSPAERILGPRSAESQRFDVDGLRVEVGERLVHSRVGRRARHREDEQAHPGDDGEAP